MRFAVLADIHGNLTALDAVLRNMEALEISTAVNLGDFFSGPLDPTTTASILMERDFISIRGTHDRYLIEQHSVDMAHRTGSASINWKESTLIG
ncbi:metallophosphoesterase family protein [Aestuariivita sp.]|jgi:predicted phosphodiesterase|uniref:metallophosphoesterase family protein n=1 Tax=Aestuariivita sp. TaxID=1872407 RepID=UPI00216F4546|nr:metallophosphoesterase family protein [Aestuariivita sp.]